MGITPGERGPGASSEHQVGLGRVELTPGVILDVDPHNLSDEVLEALTERTTGLALALQEAAAARGLKPKGVAQLAGVTVAAVAEAPPAEAAVDKPAEQAPAARAPRGRLSLGPQDSPEPRPGTPAPRSARTRDITPGEVWDHFSDNATINVAYVGGYTRVVKDLNELHQIAAERAEREAARSTGSEEPPKRRLLRRPGSASDESGQTITAAIADTSQLTEATPGEIRTMVNEDLEALEEQGALKDAQKAMEADRDLDYIPIVVPNTTITSDELEALAKRAQESEASIHELKFSSELFRLLTSEEISGNVAGTRLARILWLPSAPTEVLEAGKPYLSAASPLEAVTLWHVLKASGFDAEEISVISKLVHMGVAEREIGKQRMLPSSEMVNGKPYLSVTRANVSHPARFAISRPHE